jgi:hypothetical protein
LYVFLRRDLAHPHQVVQACHAAIEAARAFLSPPEQHPSVIVCGVRDERRLYRCLDRLRAAGIRCRPFHEPDLGNELTAVATEPLCGDRRELVSGFPLLTVNS